MDHRWFFPRQCNVMGAPQSWTGECLAGVYEYVPTKQLFEVGKADEDTEFADTSWLTMATDMQDPNTDW